MFNRNAKNKKKIIDFISQIKQQQNCPLLTNFCGKYVTNFFYFMLFCYTRRIRNLKPILL